MMSNKKWKILIISAFLFFIGICIFLYMSDFFDIDKCLDGGGRWNYETRECEE